MIGGVVVIALVVACAQSSLAASNVRRCEPVSEVPVFTDVERFMQNEDFSVIVRGYVKYTNEEGQVQYLPLKLTDYDIKPTNENHVRGRGLSLNTDCGTIEVTENAREDEFPCQYLYSLSVFKPTNPINGLTLLKIDSNPESSQYKPFMKLEWTDKHMPMFVKEREEGKRVVPEAELVFTHFYLSNGEKYSA